MPRTPIFLPQLTYWMAHNTSANNRWQVGAIRNVTNLSDQTLRRLLNDNPDLFHKTTTYPYEYFYVPTPRGDKLINDFINRNNVINVPARMETNATVSMPTQPLAPVAIPNKIPPVASQSDLPSSNAGVKEPVAGGSNGHSNWRYADDNVYAKYKNNGLTKSLETFCKAVTGGNYAIELTELPQLIVALECIMRLTEDTIKESN